VQIVEDIRSYLGEHWETISNAHGEKSEKALYLQEVGRRWGGPLEVDAASELYRVNIFEWTSADEAANSLSHEEAIGNAILSHRYHPINVPKSELKALPSWDLFLHRGHFRYLEKTTSGRIHDNEATRGEKPFVRFERPRRSVPRNSSMNEQLREMAEERAAREHREKPSEVCHIWPMADPDEEATMRLVRELVAREEQEQRDADMARDLAVALRVREPA
jgi:hypothetical protein